MKDNKTLNEEVHEAEKRVDNLAFYSCGGFTAEELLERLNKKQEVFRRFCGRSESRTQLEG